MLAYLPCDYLNGRVDEPPCLNEGLYFCTLCNHRYCDSHICMHLAAQFEHDNEGVCYESTESSRIESLSLHYQDASNNSVTVSAAISEISSQENSNDSDRKSIRLFRESTNEQLRETPEMVLRSHLSRLMSEAKRVQRELERRMIFNAEMNGIKRHSPVLTYEQRASLINNRASNAKTDKQQEREEKRRAKIQAAMDVLNKAIESGKFTKEQLITIAKKGA